MAVNLNKEPSKSINLTKVAPGLSAIKAVLSWSQAAGSETYDLDVSVFGCSNLSGAPKLVADEFFVFYNNVISPDQAIVKSADNRTGGTEEILIDIAKLDARVNEASIVVTIFEAKDGQSFGQIEDASVKIFNADTNEELCYFDLDAQFVNETAVQVGSLIRDAEGVTFQGVGAGFVLDLGSFFQGYSN
jgi:tellurium resistance protein TerD